MVCDALWRAQVCVRTLLCPMALGCQGSERGKRPRCSSPCPARAFGHGRGWVGTGSPQGVWDSGVVPPCLSVPFSGVQALRVPQGWLHPGHRACSHPKLQPHHAVLAHRVDPRLSKEATFIESF